MNVLKLKFHWQIILALVVAASVGTVVNYFSDGGDKEISWANHIVIVCEFFGKLFLRALNMVVIPLIVSSIILAVMNIARDGAFKRLGLRALFFYGVTGLIAVVLGLTVVNVLQPGNVDANVRTAMLDQVDDGEDFMEKAAGRSGKDFIEVLQRMIPPNVFKAAVENEFLALIFFSILFGYFSSRLSDTLLEKQRAFWQSINGVITAMTEFVIRFAPIGVIGLVLPTIATTGPQLFSTMGYFALTVIVALALHIGVVMPVLLASFARVNPLHHYKAMLPALLTAFSTASSASTLPLTMQCVRENVGVSKRVSSFTLPLGATVNMDGTALFECVVVIFLAQLFGLEMTFLMQLNVVLLALLTSIGVAGIPHASLVAIVIILGSVGFPPEWIEKGIGLVFIVDRLLDMMRTAVNVFGDSCVATIMGRLEGESGYYKNGVQGGD